MFCLKFEAGRQKFFFRLFPSVLSSLSVVEDWLLLTFYYSHFRCLLISSFALKASSRSILQRLAMAQR